MTFPPNDDSNIQYVGLVRRLMAIMYDLLLLLAILFIATYIANAINQGKPIGPDSPYHTIFILYLVAISFFYYGWFWTHGGQTLGMKTWRIRLQSTQSAVISWQQVVIRLITAQLSWLCAGAGFIWSLFNRQNKTWHDIASGCVLIDLR